VWFHETAKSYTILHSVLAIRETRIAQHPIENALSIVFIYLFIMKNVQ